VTHSPKIAALTALHEGLLSPKGRARLEAHLAICEICREAQGSMVLFERISGDIRTSQTPEVDWEKVARRLDEKIAVERAAMPAKAPKKLRWGASLAVVSAAAALLYWISVDTDSPAMVEAPSPARLSRAPSRVEPTRRARIAREPQIMDDTAHLIATVTLRAGDVRIREDGIEHSADVDDQLVEGAAIETELDSELHLRIATRTGIALSEESHVRFAVLRDENVVLALERGHIASVVHAEGFRSSSRFVVMASEYRFEGHATHFEVELEADSLRLDVAEGEVRVHRPDGRVETVRAPGHWSANGSSSEDGRTLQRPYGLDGEAQAMLRADHPDIVRWEIGDLAFEGRGQLAMRVGLGALSITGFDEDGRAFRRVADIGGDGLTIDAHGLVADAPRVRANGFLPEREIREVVERGQLRLRQCYEQGLRERPDLEGQMRVQITVGLDGSVMRYRVTSGDIPEGMQACVRNYVERWSFPPPRGGTVTFEAPLSFGRAGL
jgi:ferric-dicitrate binding protein FerR (iron transport regulator)